MSLHDFTSQRLFVEADLRTGASLGATDEQFNYLVRVLRMGTGDAVLVFNGRDGEWRATLSDVGKRSCTLLIEAQVRAQASGPDITYVFAPLKRARLDYMVQKAVELGVRRLVPVLTRRTVAERVNFDRLRANVIEAAEQCGILHVADIAPLTKLDRYLSDWDAPRRLIFCDEAAPISDPIAALTPLRGQPVAVLIGPEGGFDDYERDLVRAFPLATAISLGPRIMRADTAAIAALTLVNATIGDWR
jgi:16S rRNA (uracil1498-N3)-methyltransferase